jgi:hypothetical protein
MITKEFSLRLRKGNFMGKYTGTAEKMVVAAEHSWALPD